MALYVDCGYRDEEKERKSSSIGFNQEGIFPTHSGAEVDKNCFFFTFHFLPYDVLFQKYIKNVTQNSFQIEDTTIFELSRPL